jgi:hypothetical protein
MAFTVIKMFRSDLRLFIQRICGGLVGAGVVCEFRQRCFGLAIICSFVAPRCFVGIGEAAYGPVAPTVYRTTTCQSARTRSLIASPSPSAALGFVLGEQNQLPVGWQWAFGVVLLPVCIGLGLS